MIKIKTDFDNITVADFENASMGKYQCLLLHNTALNNLIFKYSQSLQERCQSVFLSIQKRLSSALDNRNFSIAQNLQNKLMIWDMKRTIFALIYNKLRYTEPDKQDIEILRDNGIIYNPELSQADNLNIIFGQIGRCEAVLSETRIKLESINKSSDEVHSMDYILMTLNNAASSNLRKKDTTLNEFLAVKKIVEKIASKNENTK